MIATHNSNESLFLIQVKTKLGTASLVHLLAQAFRKSNIQSGSVATHQEALLYVSLLDAGETATLSIAPTRTGYVHLARGKLNLNGQQMEAGDGAALIDESEIQLSRIDHAVL